MGVRAMRMAGVATWWREMRCWCAAIRHLERDLAYEKADKLQGHCVSLAVWWKSCWAELTAGVFGFWFIHFLVSTAFVSRERKTLIYSSPVAILSHSSLQTFATQQVTQVMFYLSIRIRCICSICYFAPILF